MFSSLKKGLNQAGNKISKELDSAGRSINHALDAQKTSTVLCLYQTGNVIQLISRSSGRALQLLQAPNGPLLVDGGGPIGSEFLHAHWTVFNEGNNCVKLYNNTNYLAIVNGITQVINVPNPALAGIETRFRLSQVEQFILLESFKETGRYIGVLPTGELKPALATGREMNAHFGTSLIYSPYAGASAAAPVEVQGAPPPYSANTVTTVYTTKTVTK